MGAAWSGTSSLQAFSNAQAAQAFAERRSSSALLDKGFASLERDFEASNRRFETDHFPVLPVRSSAEEADFDQLESPAVSPQHVSDSWHKIIRALDLLH